MTDLEKILAYSEACKSVDKIIEGLTYDQRLRAFAELVKSLLPSDDHVFVLRGSTPTFNDGDPCNFSYDFGVTTISKEKFERDIKEDDFDLDELLNVILDDAGEYCIFYDEEEPEILKIKESVGSLPDDFMESIVNNTSLVITKDRIEVGEYESY